MLVGVEVDGVVFGDEFEARMVHYYKLRLLTRFLQSKCTFKITKNRFFIINIPKLPQFQFIFSTPNNRNTYKYTLIYCNFTSCVLMHYSPNLHSTYNSIRAQLLQPLQFYNIIQPAIMQQVELYPRFMGHQLRTTLPATVVGKCADINTKRNSAILQTDPESKLNIQVLVGEEQLQLFKVGKVYEVRGVCRSGREIEMRGFTCFGVDFDLSSYNQMLLLATKQFRSIFYS